MILETTQLLYTAHHQLQKNDNWAEKLPKKPYRATHVNHPVSRWVRQCPANYIFAANLGLSLCKEYTFRYFRIHSSQTHIEWLVQNIPPFDQNL
jgi:hypothetical protein